jgi:hypothetical protein
MQSAQGRTGAEKPTPGRRFRVALMSALVYPGAGQFLNRRFGKGVLFAGLATVAVLGVAIEVAVVVVAAMPSDAFMLDPVELAGRVHQTLAHAGGRITAWLVGLAGVWLVSVIDAWRDARPASPRGVPAAVSRTRSSVERVDFSADALLVSFSDGRTVSAPLAWWPGLTGASPEARRAWKLLDGGRRLRWPALETEISVDELLGPRD